jgi:hypothetical protein
MRAPLFGGGSFLQLQEKSDEKDRPKVSIGNRVGSGFGGYDEARRCSNHGLQGCDAVAWCRGARLRWRDTIHHPRF